MRQLDILTILMVVLVLLLTGCGSVLEGTAHGAANDESASWPEWTGDWEERNDRFTLNYDPEVTPGPWLFIIDQVWRDVQACVGIAAPDPGITIEYVPLSQLPITEDNRQVFAYIVYRSRYIRVQEDDLNYWYRNNSLRHEFVHYLLWWAGASQGVLDNHNSPFYEECQV